MDFAPYQSSPPEHTRPFSPAKSPSPRASLDRARPQPHQFRSSNLASPPPLQHPQPQRQWTSNLGGNDGATTTTTAGSWVGGGGGGSPLRGIVGGGGNGGGVGYGNEPGYGVDAFTTSLGVRLDYEAAAAYLAVPPLGAILLLILERKSDYVR